MKNCVLECFEKNGEVWVVTSDGRMSLFDKKGDAIYLDSVPKSIHFGDIYKLKVTGKYDVKGEKVISLDEIAQFSELKSLTLENVTIDVEGKQLTLPANLNEIALHQVEGFDPTLVVDADKTQIRGYKLPDNKKRK